MEFANLGKHCEEITCKQKDFLPFECKFCKKTFCLEHREFKAHDCKCSEIGSKKAIVCPICEKTLFYLYGEDENQICLKHMSTDCIEKNTKIIETKYCCLETCLKKLTLLDTCDCKNCNNAYCLKHRYEDVHKCKENIRKIRENNFLKKKETPIFPQATALKPTQNMETINNNQRINRNNESLEFCYVCGKSFSDITELITHAESMHIKV